MGEFSLSYSPSTPNVDVNDIYGKLLYYPRVDIGSANQTLESLNGGIDYRHFSPFPKMTDGLEAGCFRTGTFARGYNYAFNFPDRYHASMYAKSDGETDWGKNPSARLYHTHQSFATRFFVPWPAVCFVGYQGWFSAELTKFKGKEFGERWDLKLNINGHNHLGSYVKMASTRNATEPGYSTDSSHEYRWRWFQRSLQFKAQRGFNTIKVLNWPKIKREYADSEDRTAPKMVAMCGGMWVLALRVGHLSTDYSEDNEVPSHVQLPYDGGAGTNAPFDVPTLHPDFSNRDVDQKVSIDDASFANSDVELATFSTKAQERFGTLGPGPQFRDLSEIEAETEDE